MRVRRAFLGVAWLAPVAAAWAQEAVVVRGVVHDSLHAGQPLAGAEVMLDGVDAIVTTDARGRFAFERVPVGRYRATFFHGALEALGVPAPVRTLDVGPRDLDVTLYVPTGAQLYAAACGTTPDAGLGVVVGRVVRGPDRVGVAGAQVVASWRVLGVSAQGITSMPRDLATRSDAEGRYRLCGVPADAPVHVAVRTPTGDQHLQELSLQGEPWRLHAVTLEDAAPDASALTVTVRDAVGAPVRNALVGYDDPRAVRTDAQGVARLSTPGPADRQVEVRALGFRPVVARVTGDGRRLVVTLDAPVATLAARTITARRASRDPTGFESRRLADAGGTFLTGEQIANRRAYHVSDLFATIPGVNITPHGRSNIITMGRSIGSRGGFGTRCFPIWYLDGTLLLEPTRNLATADTTPNIERDGLRPDMLDQLASPKDIAGIEVYKSAVTAPPQFATIGAECGVIVVWTKRGQAATLLPP
jgi:hypothetical protein